MTEYSYGHCVENAKPGGCQLHNLHCGYPNCDRRALTGAQPAPAAPSEPMYLQGYRDALAHAAFYVRDHCQHGEEHAETVLNLKLPAAAPAAQPADSAMTAEQIEALAHRKAWRYKHSSDPAHSDTYTFNRATLLEFARALVAKETPHAR